MIEIRPFRESETEDVVALWEACGLTRPWNDPRKDIARKLTVQRDLFLVAVDGGAVVGTAMAGFDGHRGWVYYVAVAPERQRGGVGATLMREVEQRLTAIGCPKAEILVRAGNESVVTFYEHLGYARESAAAFGRRLIPDD